VASGGYGYGYGLRRALHLLLPLRPCARGSGQPHGLDVPSLHSHPTLLECWIPGWEIACTQELARRTHPSGLFLTSYLGHGSDLITLRPAVFRAGRL
jgi:hypothetical protein